MAQVSFSDLVDGVIHTAAHHNDRFNALKSRINAIQSDNLEDSSVTGPKIAMGSDAQGDILIRGVTSYQRLAAGTSGQFLKTLGAGANPLWADSGITADNVALSTLKIRAVKFAGDGSNGAVTPDKTIGGSHTVNKDGTGVYTITWATAFADANYIVQVTAKDDNAGGTAVNSGAIATVASNPTTTACTIKLANDGSTARNAAQVHVFAIGT